MRRFCLAQIGDSHWDHTSRWAETCELHTWIQGSIAERCPDAILHTGDMYERASVPQERIMVVEWLCDLGQTAPVLVIRGNHDELVDIDIFRALKSRHRIAVEEAFGFHDLGPFAVAALAWPRQAEVLAHLGKPVTERESAEVAQTALRNVLGGMGIELQRLREKDGCPTILAAHAMVRGSLKGPGQPLVGCDMELGIEDLALAEADYVGLGHIHMQQSWTYNGAPIVYAGSPRRTEFGELEDKGYVYVEFRDEPFDGASKGPRGWWVKWEHVVAPARPMLLLSADFVDGVLHFANDLPLKNAEVRLTYATDRDHRIAAKAAAAELCEKLLAEGAFMVKPEESVRTQTRARAPELARATSLAEKLDVFWASKSIELSPERKARMLARLAKLQRDNPV